MRTRAPGTVTSPEFARGPAAHHSPGVHAALSVMQRHGAPVLGEVALEVCQRTNTKAAITGSISKATCQSGLHRKNSGILVTSDWIRILELPDATANAVCPGV